MHAQAFFGARLPAAPARAPTAARRRSAALLVRADSVLIVNTKGGGHAFLGLHLAKKLVAGGHSVTILNDGDAAKLEKKDPFAQYGSTGATVVWGSPTDAAALPAGPFDVVYDNNGKDMDACGPLIAHFSAQKERPVKHYVYVSSAGAYVADATQPQHFEGDARKPKAGHVAVEAALAASPLPWTVFQPQYIYGPHTAKDCEQWFFDRVARGRPVPIPAPGVQLVGLAHVDDLAELLASVVGRPEAVRQHFNLSSDRAVTLDGVARAAAAAAGTEAKIVHYDPKKVELAKGEAFPFRAVHFFVSMDKAKRVLGWRPKHSFVADVGDLYKAYVASGRASKDVDFAGDDKILAAVGAK